MMVDLQTRESNGEIRSSNNTVEHLRKAEVGCFRRHAYPRCHPSALNLRDRVVECSERHELCTILEQANNTCGGREWRASYAPP
eukprot:SAG31_NODE_828_length_11716_cov_4.405785_9_plen_84_part_00